MGTNVVIDDLVWDGTEPGQPGNGTFEYAFDVTVGSAVSILGIFHASTYAGLNPGTAVLTAIRGQQPSQDDFRTTTNDYPNAFGCHHANLTRCISGKMGDSDSNGPAPADSYAVLPGPGTYYIGFWQSRLFPEQHPSAFITPAANDLGGEKNPVVFPTVANPTAPTDLVAIHSSSGVSLTWTKAAHRHSRFSIYYATSRGVTTAADAIRITEAEANCETTTLDGATTHDRACTYTIPYADLTGITDNADDGYFRVTAHVNENASGLSGEATTNPSPTVGASSTLNLIPGQTGRISMHNISDPESEPLEFSITEHPDSAIATASIDTATGEVTVVAEGNGRTRVTISATDGKSDPVTQTFTILVNPPPAASSSSGGVVLLAIAGAGAYFWWKKRQIANGNAAKMALLPDVSFDLDRNDNRAFYTKMNWANSSHSNWQLRGNAKIHTKYSGKLLDWHANSHIGYRLRGKFGDFNPYFRGKFVQNAPENAEMDETYTVGVNYAIPNRFSVQFLQPDDEIWRYSLKTEMQLPRKIVLNFNQPNSDIWRYSANLNWRISERIGLNLSQPNNDLPNYGFGIQWRNKSKIRYGISGETGRNSYRFTGEFWF